MIENHLDVLSPCGSLGEGQNKAGRKQAERENSQR